MLLDLATSTLKDIYMILIWYVALLFFFKKINTGLKFAQTAT
jgi:hypothetical protein